MSESLRDELVRSLSQMRKFKASLPPQCTLPMGEYFLLFHIHKLAFHEDDFPFCKQQTPQKPVFVKDVSAHLHMSMPAVSQILRSLDEKGLIVRQMTREDRRKISLSLTNEGHAILNEVKAYYDEMMAQLIDRIGSKDILEFIRIFDSMIAAVTQLHDQHTNTEGNEHSC